VTGDLSYYATRICSHNANPRSDRRAAGKGIASVYRANRKPIRRTKRDIKRNIKLKAGSFTNPRPFSLRKILEIHFAPYVAVHKYGRNFTNFSENSVQKNTGEKSHNFL
jgi:hypothetical protein